MSSLIAIAKITSSHVFSRFDLVYWARVNNSQDDMAEPSFDMIVSKAPVSRVPRSWRSHVVLPDACSFIYTSGTTGPSKAVRIPHMVYVLASGGGFRTGLRANDVFYNSLPYYHSAGKVKANTFCHMPVEFWVWKNQSTSHADSSIYRIRQDLFSFLGDSRNSILYVREGAERSG